jgi:hypothetical protein
LSDPVKPSCPVQKDCECYNDGEKFGDGIQCHSPQFFENCPVLLRMELNGVVNYLNTEHKAAKIEFDKILAETGKKASELNLDSFSFFSGYLAALEKLGNNFFK